MRSVTQDRDELDMLVIPIIILVSQHIVEPDLVSNIGYRETVFGDNLSY
jgi:hypothetical protein